MKKLVKYIVLGCFIGFSINGFSQEGYLYKRKIELKKDTLNWNSVEIPDEMYDKVKSDLSDIRIFGFKDNDTIEVRYTLHKNPDFELERKQELKIINQTVSDGKYYFTIQAFNEILNQLSLKFTNDNFDWKINLEGSHNQDKWFKILEDYRILSINNSETNYRFEDLFFNNSKYNYYRISINSNEQPKLKTVHSSYSQSKDSLSFRTIRIDKLVTKTDKKNKITTIEFSLENPVPVYSISIDVNKKFDFKRAVTVEYLQDSTKTEKGYIRHYGYFSSGILSSKQPSEYPSNNELKFIKNFKITIDNQDNKPLDIKSVALQSLYFNMIFLIDDNEADYYLYYGNQKSYRPSYDAYFMNVLDKSNLRLSDEILIPKKQEIVQKPLFENKLWLWGIMILIIVILGYFSVKMITKKE